MEVLIIFLAIVAKAKSLLRLCGFAIQFEINAQDTISSIALDHSLFEENKIESPYLVTSENNLLSLASYNECTNGILYALVLKFSLENQDIYDLCQILLVF